VLGRNAHLINSLRSLLSAVAGKNKISIDLDYVTDGENRQVMKESPGNFIGARE
jgi:hypothetical protein